MKLPFCEIVIDKRVVKKYRCGLAGQAAYLAGREKIIGIGKAFQVMLHLSMKRHSKHFRAWKSLKRAYDRINKQFPLGGGHG